VGEGRGHGRVTAVQRVPLCFANRRFCRWGVDLFPSWWIVEKFKNNPATAPAPGALVLAGGWWLGPKAICKISCWGFFASGQE